MSLPPFVILTIVLICGLVKCESDPCKTYKTINNPYRSIKYRLQSSDVPICDSNLPSGWYRFTSFVGGKMPETRPDPYYCGTVAPVWMNGTHPTTVNETKAVTACTNVFGANDGCKMREQIAVKHCGSYFVYKLSFTDGCSMAYCAGDKQPCPKGLTGIVPNCIELILAKFPEDLVPKPSVSFFKHKESPTFSMLCKFGFSNWKNVSFAVEWLAYQTIAKELLTFADTHGHLQIRNIHIPYLELPSSKGLFPTQNSKWRKVSGGMENKL